MHTKVFMGASPRPTAPKEEQMLLDVNAQRVAAPERAAALELSSAA